MKKLALLILSLVSLAQINFGQTGLQKHNPLLDFNLSPSHNDKINPTANSAISPKYNWNLSPLHNDALNPTKVNNINPQLNGSVNPNLCENLNPMFTNALHPKNPAWSGNFLFDKDDKLIGFVSVANQQVMLCFNAAGEWNGYFVRSAIGTFNEFSLDGKWTGRFLCPDSSEGYNLFSSEGDWTGEHIK